MYIDTSNWDNWWISSMAYQCVIHGLMCALNLSLIKIVTHNLFGTQIFIDLLWRRSPYLVTYFPVPFWSSWLSLSYALGVGHFQALLGLVSFFFLSSFQWKPSNEAYMTTDATTSWNTIEHENKVVGLFYMWGWTYTEGGRLVGCLPVIQA